MKDISLEPLTPGELDRYSHWFSQHATSLLFKSPTNSATSRSGKTLAWKSLREGEVVAVTIINPDAQNYGTLNLVVTPNARRQGVGSETLRLLLQNADVRALRGLTATVEPASTGGQKVLLKNGFARRGTDPEGQLQFRYDVSA